MLEWPVQGIAHHGEPATFAAVKIALVGNPNTGKSTLFQRLTGTSVSVGNLAGVTVATATGPCKVRGSEHWLLHDLPGIYNLHAQAEDGRITQRTLFDANHSHHPDVIFLVADARTLKGQLFLALQVRELGVPCILLLNDMRRNPSAPDDLIQKAETLSRHLDLPVQIVNALDDDPVAWVSVLAPLVDTKRIPALDTPPWPEDLKSAANQLQGAMPHLTPEVCAHLLRMHDAPEWLSDAEQNAWRAARVPLERAATLQLNEAGERMAHIQRILPDAESSTARADNTSRRLDRAMAHPVWGVLGFGLLFFVMFQAVYSWATVPTDLLDGWMASGIDAVSAALPDTWWRSLIVDGALAGLAGILIFLPQIMILFGFTALLEHSGAMARLGFVGERFLRKLGLGGRSTVSLVGGMACAVPAVMAARALPDRRERLLTILVTPLMTCSARLPVYAFLIAFVVPDGTWLGMNRQGLFLYGLYLASTAATLLMAWLLHRSLPQDRERLEHAEEWPPYRIPRLSLVLGNMVRQGSVFVRSAGQVILVLSVVLWGLGFLGQGSLAERQAMEPAQRLETSVLGAVGDAIEPIVSPLGYDGRLGIAVLSSFAAREVFVGTVQTLYPTPDGSTPKVSELKARLAQETHPRTGRPLLTTASAASLIVFYMFAMQCLSTVAIVRSELNSWPWALGQAATLTLLAYLLAWITHAVLA